MNEERPQPSVGSLIQGPDDFAAAFDVSRETIDRLATYEALLRQWQKAVNLVAPSTLDAVWHRHFADSAQLLPLAPDTRTWVDLGSGAGFPGLVVAILLAERGIPAASVVSTAPAARSLLPSGRRCPVVSKTRLRHEGADEGAFTREEGSPPSPVRPNNLQPLPGGMSPDRPSKAAAVSHGLTSSLPGGEGVRDRSARQTHFGDSVASRPRVTLIESNARKCAFLREVVRQTGISVGVTVDILSIRIETAATQPNLRAPDVVSARALAPLDKLLALAAPLFTSSTVGLFLKGRDVAAELKAAESLWNFNVEMVPSRTERDGRIVVVRNLEAKSEGMTP
jgi:16S rRNA (guanine527-N7)-methyltransferase